MKNLIATAALVAFGLFAGNVSSSFASVTNASAPTSQTIKKADKKVALHAAKKHHRGHKSKKHGK